MCLLSPAIPQNIPIHLNFTQLLIAQPNVVLLLHLESETMNILKNGWRIQILGRPTILENILSLVLQNFPQLAAFQCNTLDLLKHMV